MQRILNLSDFYYTIIESDNTFIQKTSIKDNLESDDNTEVLSAKQGKKLKNLIDDKINFIDIDENLTLYIGFKPVVSNIITSEDTITEKDNIISIKSTIKTADNQPLAGVPVNFYINE